MVHRFRRSFKIVLPYFVFIASVIAEGATYKKCVPDFQYTNGWLGADAAYSISISPSKDLWIFQDTFVGLSGQRSRSGSKIISNSIGISSCINSQFEIKYYWGEMHSHAPKPFFDSKTSKFKYWPVHGFVHENIIYVFLIKVETTSSDQFGFKYIGVDLAKITVHDESPSAWNIDIVPFANSRTAFPGVAVHKHGREVLLFTVLNGEKDKSHDLVLNRLQLSKIEQEDYSLETLTKTGEWESGLKWMSAKRVLKKGSTELSVHFDSKLGSWVAIHTAPQFLSRYAVYRTAKSIYGPWSKNIQLLKFPEMDTGKDTFCYAAKAHVQFSKPGEPLVTYVCNSSKFSKQVNDLQIYRPIAGSYLIR